MRFFGLLNRGTNTIKVLTFDDGRPVPFPFMRKAGENRFMREARRTADHLALMMAKTYSNDEMQGRTAKQVQASEAFHEARSLSIASPEIVVEIDAASFPIKADTKLIHIPKDYSNYEIPQWVIDKRRKAQEQAQAVAAPAAEVEIKIQFDQKVSAEASIRPENDSSAQAESKLLADGLARLRIEEGSASLSLGSMEGDHKGKEEAEIRPGMQVDVEGNKLQRESGERESKARLEAEYLRSESKRKADEAKQPGTAAADTVSLGAEHDGLEGDFILVENEAESNEAEKSKIAIGYTSLR